MTDEQEILKQFAEQVHEKALSLMEQDGKVEGKHYAAMKIILKEKGVTIQLP